MFQSLPSWLWLDQVMTVSLLGSALSYGSWAFQHLGYDVYRELLAISFLPFLPIILVRFSSILGKDVLRR